MSTVTFDTLRLVDKLKTAGFAAEQAEAVVRIVAEAQEDLTAKKDLQLEPAPLRADLGLLKWMVGFNLAVSLGVLWKLPH